MESLKIHTRRQSSHTQSGAAKKQAPAAVALTKAYLGESPLASILGETVALFHRLRVVTEQIHRQGEMTSGKRGILGSLDSSGPQTVPHMARARPVSRQYIQSLVHELAEEGYIAFQENPAHKRSQLVRLTPKGKELFHAMLQREVQVLSQLKLGLPAKELQTAASVLRAVREMFESKEWKRLL